MVPSSMPFKVDNMTAQGLHLSIFTVYLGLQISCLISKGQFLKCVENFLWVEVSQHLARLTLMFRGAEHTQLLSTEFTVPLKINSCLMAFSPVRNNCCFTEAY